MKHRWIPVAVICVVLGAVVMTKGSELVSRHFMNEASSQAHTTLRLAVSALGGHLSRYEPLPALMADHDDIEELVSNPSNQLLRDRANIYLKEINTLLHSSDIYVMTLDGETIAASNFDGPASFIGQNFSYRPYFQEAAAGQQSRFFALGTTSHKRGYYFSSPILFENVIKGVIVFKVDIEGIEASFGNGENRIIVSDPEGIIFMTGTPEWLYASLLPLTRDRLLRTEASRRYSDATLRELPLNIETNDGHTLFKIASGNGEQEYLALSQLMPEAGWTVRVLVDTSSVRNQVRTTVIAAVLCLCLAGFMLAAVLQRRASLQERMILQAETQAELERRVTARTEDLERVNRHIAREIAERRQTEKQLRKTQGDLIQAGKLAGLGQMSAALSHEFNQPLAAAKTYADSASLLIGRGRVEEASDNLKRISALIDRMASISRHLRNFARKPNEKMTSVDLDEAMQDTLEILHARLRAANAELIIDFGAEPLSVKAGLVRVQQVLVNIISNAADAVETLEDRRIFVTARQEDKRVLLSVRDYGPGVPPAIMERIFDPFFTTKGVGRGLGLGLSISYNIIKDFGGELRVRNPDGGGAEFIIELSIAERIAEVAAE